MTRARHRLAAAGAAVLLGLAGAASLLPGLQTGASADAASPGGKGTPGYCPTKQGVTVVVDFNQLGGGIVVRCAPGPVGSGYTGLDALEDAGFSPQGTARWGMQFICRLAGEPAPDQKLHVEGDPNYKEKCVDTPPAEAFWGYWYAPNGGSWTYSNDGPLNRDAIPGGFEGWSFSLNHTRDTAPPPGIAPQRPQKPPHTSPPPTTPPKTTPPSTPPPTHPTGHRGGGAGHGRGHGSGHGPGGSGGGPPTAPTGPPTPTAPPTTGAPPPTTAAHTGQGHRGAASGAHGRGGHHARAESSTLSLTPSPTADPLAVGHNAAGEKVSGQLPGTAAVSDGGSPRNAVIGILVVAALAAGGFVAWRRRAGSDGPG